MSKYAIRLLKNKFYPLVASDNLELEEGEYVVYQDELGEDVVIKGAESYWREVIRMNTNYELAYLGIGKALNRRGEYKEAMKYFELAHNATYYSKAFNSYRDAVLNENFSLLMAVIMVAVAGVAISKITTYVNKKNKENAMKEEGGNE